MKLAQILDSKAHWIFDPIDRFGTTDLSDRFEPSILFVEITDEVKEGWKYDDETGIFTEPPAFIPEPLPEQPQLSPAEQAQLDNDELLLDMYLLQLDTQLSLQTGGGTV